MRFGVLFVSACEFYSLVMKVEIIKESGFPAYAILPYADYIQLIQKLEAFEDIQVAREISQRIKSGAEEVSLK